MGSARTVQTPPTSPPNPGFNFTNQLAAQQSPDPQTRAEALNTLCDLLAQRITELKLLATTREIEDEGVRDALMVGVGQMERLEGRGEGWWDL
ncbi:MAG: hypothetical protein L6R36_007727 [Xanthoria steineri]|nr:MAG: hypothetical protein L6R36_007727 [Xanthoria steineri]